MNAPERGTEAEGSGAAFNSRVRRRGNEKQSGPQLCQTETQPGQTETCTCQNEHDECYEDIDQDSNTDDSSDLLQYESEPNGDELGNQIKRDWNDNEQLSEQCQLITTLLNETLTKIENALEADNLNNNYEGLSKRKDVYFCRICHEIGNKQRFISPCMCKGSLYLVHKSCLETWLAASDSTQCELCGFTYRTQRLPKYMVFSSIFAWLLCPSSGPERRMLLWDIMTLMVLLPLMILCSILGLRVANNVLSPDVQIKMGEAVMTRVLQMVLLSGVLLLDLGVLSWGAIRIQYHFHQWYIWYRKNCKVILLDFLDHPDFPLQTLSHASSASVRVINF
ncbi:E3 ubiquitin-protein ligase MARCH2-like [Cimex lectularius]|uniref:RING-CH-type domain-containing protein n=1 Tax=Cimex lectularius TaxID=79782 RepID=A0A8I6RVH3_CIMLE|nr:E3 ubiquitin-protein ligase MARCH2-like [Cimex lectularius]